MTKRLALVTLGVGLLAVFALAACRGTSTSQSTESHTVDTQIDEVRFSGGSGSVKVRTQSGAQATVERRIRYTDNNRPGATDRVEGAALILETDCGRNCSVDYTVTLPKAIGLSGQLSSGSVEADGVTGATVRTSSGDVTISNASGPVTARTNSGEIAVRDTSGTVAADTTSGDITVVDAKGGVTAQATSGSVTVSRIVESVTVKTNSGNISGEGLAGGRCEVRSESGNIELAFSGTPDITADASSGNIELTVPPGQAYKVSAETSSGNRSVDVTNDPAATHAINARTSSGNIDIRAA